MPVVDFHDHLVLTPVLHERTHGSSTEQCLQRPPDGHHGDPEIGALVAMRFHRQVRCAQRSIHAGRHEPGVGGQPRHQLLGGLLQLLIVQPSEHELHGRLLQPVADGGRIKKVRLHPGQRTEVLIQVRDDLLLAFRAFLPILQRHPTLGTVDPRRTVAESYHCIRMGDLRNRLEQRFQFFGVGVGIAKRGALRRREKAGKPSHVFERR